MNYAQSRQDALQMKEQLLKRREEIAQEKARLDRMNGEIERQLVGLDQVLEGLEFLSNGTPLEIETPGFTDEIRKILQDTTVSLTALEIRDSLVAAGRTSTKNLLISVHTVLGRLESDLTKSEKNGKAAYIWKHTRVRRHVFPSGRARVSLDTLLGTSPATAWPLAVPPVPGKKKE